MDRVPVLLAQCMLLAACASGSSRQVAQPAPDTVVVVESVGRPTAEYRALEQQVAELQLRLLEREAQVLDLQEKHDEAMQEVVRTKAKLRSVESKAEAASTMAEAEIALKTLRLVVAGKQPGTGVMQAAQLLEMSAREFEQENFGGSLYLASQAKSLISRGQGQLSGDRLLLSDDEILFAAPLPLQVVRTSNVRDGPGRGFRILFTLEPGASLTGHARKDRWVRIRDEDGRDGWIFHTLVGSRSEGNQ